MKKIIIIPIIIVLLVTESCITQFVPDFTEAMDAIVVDGILSDNPAIPTRVILTRSLPLGSKDKAIPVTGCTVWITDDQGGNYNLYEAGNWGWQSRTGVYTSDMKGTVGRTYTLHIRTNYNSGGIYEPSELNYTSYPMEMKPVPEVDALYYEKKEIAGTGIFGRAADGCQVYVDTHDPTNECRFFRWDYDETWQIYLPFADAINPTCWITRRSGDIHVKSTAGLSESKVSRYPLNFISNQSDRLSVKYSILVNQYSLTQNEFLYWEKLKSVTQNVGSLYDVTPAAIPNNIYCIEDPTRTVLGYFSVSSMKSKRIFVRDYFRGQPNLYADCIHDTLHTARPNLPNLNVSVWILESYEGNPGFPAYTTITYTRGCADCTVRGTNQRPAFWE
jgi:hypothetical protein